MTSTATPSADRAPYSLSLPFVPESARVARHQIHDWLAELGATGEVADDCRLIVSELVGNSVRHAQPLDDGTMQVAWVAADDALDITVTDGGAETEPHRVEAELTALSGRGLAIVDAVARRWWIETALRRTTVHAILPLA